MVWGWCVAGAAFLPYALYVLAAAPFLPAVAALALWLAGTLGPLVLVDRLYYGTWTVSGRNVFGFVGPWALQHVAAKSANVALLNELLHILPAVLLPGAATCTAGLPVELCAVQRGGRRRQRAVWS